MASPSSSGAQTAAPPRTPPPSSTPPAPSSHLTAALGSLVPRWLTNSLSSSSLAQADPPPETADPDESPLVSEVSRTSQTCAAARAAEGTLAPAGRLFTDRLAAHLAGVPRARTRPPSPRVAIRTRYFDDFAEGACRGANGATQLVILGAGMDTRAHRLAGLAGVVVYEVDVREVLELKEALLAAAEAGGADTSLSAIAVKRVAADVRCAGWDGRLVEAGFDWRVRSAFILEGLVYYLQADRVRAMLRCVKALACEGSVICMSTVGAISENRRVLEGDALENASSKVRSIPKFVFACPQPRLFLGNLGFRVATIAELGGEAANYGRWPEGQDPASNTMYVTFEPNKRRR